jgi:hypothetical protein
MVSSLSITPLGKRKSIRIVELTIPRTPTLSIQKRDCEKYLLRITVGIWYSDVDSRPEDYRK